MPSQARVGDMWVGVCCCHVDPQCIPMTGTVITGGVGQESKDFAITRISNLVQGSCGHVGNIVTGSGKSFTNTLGKAFVGSLITGCNVGNIVTGAANHITY